MDETTIRIGSGLLWLVPAIPLAGSVVNLFAGRRLGRAAGTMAAITVAASFVLAAYLVVQLLSIASPEGRLVQQHLFDWISVGSFTVGADLRLDTLSAVMILVVTGVGTLIHVYAIGYMEGDPRYGRFFAFLNLFVFFMLLLVLADDYALLYVGWEGVGLCSYLLIGFWFEERTNAVAAKKAFVTTRVGDTAMLVGLALIVANVGSLGFDRVFGAAGGVGEGTATAVSLLLFAGAIGKSAQVPLHVWLPDAMAGPTPVSALIHAATMVTAGVYLVVRSAPLFEASPIALTVVLVVGLVTALFAATCALGQDDIKRVLAYSTVSQLGFMFVAAGMRFYSGAIFMLVAHAFYKALMFLGAGSVMHGMHDETDLKRMGGLRRRMPFTTWTFAIGALALAGVFPLAGFFAKDQILEVAQHTGRAWIYVLGTAAAVLSALYIGRLLFLAFFGEPRSEEARHAHESPPVMWVPLALLAGGAVLAGVVLSSSADGALARLLEPVTGPIPEGEGGLPTVVLSAIATAIALAMLALAWWVYASGRVDWLALRERLAPLQRAAANGWYVDDYYSAVFVRPGVAGASALAGAFDLGVIDRAANGVGGGVRRLAAGGRRIQTGFVRSYALGLFVGAVGVLVWLGTRL
jgi:NADH-quinone oxidoreductase subunit L